jgi:hypothetical protein
MNSKNATDNAQDNQNEPAQSTAPDGTHSESQCAMNTGSPTPLQAHINQAALERLAARLARHLATLDTQKGNNHG